MALFEYLCYGSTAITIIVHIFSAGIDFWRIMSVPALKGLSSPVKRSDITRWKQRDNTPSPILYSVKRSDVTR